MSDQVRVTREGPLLRLILTRPEKRNALTSAMYEALSDALASAAIDAAIGAVLLAGSDGVFTAGNDIGDFLAWTGDGGTFPAMRFIRALIGCPKPLVAAVDGLAIGIGTTLTLHCDLVYASPTALFRVPFVDLGLVPEAGSSMLLPQRVGPIKATELLLLGDPFDAAEALRLGLVNAVVDRERLMEHAATQALRLAAQPRAALLASRGLLRGDRAALLARVDEEERAFATALASPEAQSRLASFGVKPVPPRRAG